MKRKSSPKKSISNDHLTNKSIVYLVNNPKIRKHFEALFRLSEDQEKFLKDFSDLEGAAGEWKFLSEKFMNESLKKAAWERFEREKAKNSCNVPTVEEAKLIPVVESKDSLWKALCRTFFGFLAKKPSA